MNIIIIALGTIPNFLDDCIEQIKFTQKNPTIHIIKNETSNYKNNDCIIVDVENIPASQKHLNFIKESELINKNFRDYFWRYSSERLYVIDDYLQMQNLKDVIHIETDVLLYQDLEIIFSIMHNFDFACVRDSDTRVIGSIIYIKDKNISGKITSIANNYINENDMIILNHVAKKLENVFYLPTGNKKFNKKNLKFIFDGACIGQFVGGIDPRNEPKNLMKYFHKIKKIFTKNNIISFINKESNIDVSKWEIKWIKNKPYKKCNDELIPIVNLHIHSKNLKKFMKME